MTVRYIDEHRGEFGVEPGVYPGITSDEPLGTTSEVRDAVEQLGER